MLTLWKTKYVQMKLNHVNRAATELFAKRSPALMWIIESNFLYITKRLHFNLSCLNSLRNNDSQFIQFIYVCLSNGIWSIVVRIALCVYVCVCVCINHHAGLVLRCDRIPLRFHFVFYLFSLFFFLIFSASAANIWLNIQTSASTAAHSFLLIYTIYTLCIHCGPYAVYDV